jgi:hypothetical protein
MESLVSYHHPDRAAHAVRKVAGVAAGNKEWQTVSGLPLKLNVQSSREKLFAKN